MERVTADFNELMKQAPGTVATYMRVLVQAVDDHFGEGYAKKHPELLGSLVLASTHDFDTAIHAKLGGEIADYLCDISTYVRALVGRVHPSLLQQYRESQMNRGNENVDAG